MRDSKKKDESLRKPGAKGRSRDEQREGERERAKKGKRAGESDKEEPVLLE